MPLEQLWIFLERLWKFLGQMRVLALCLQPVCCGLSLLGGGYVLSGICRCFLRVLCIRVPLCYRGAPHGRERNILPLLHDAVIPDPARIG